LIKALEIKFLEKLNLISIVREHNKPKPTRKTITDKFLNKNNKREKRKD